MKAVIRIGGKQYVVAEKQTLLVDKLDDKTKTFEAEPLMVMDGDTFKVGTPTVKGVKVSAKVIDPILAGEKIQVIKFKAKKRVKTITGHRQKYTKVEISKIA